MNAGLLAILLAGLPAGSAAQPVATLDSVPSCRLCRIMLGAPIPLRGGGPQGALPNIAQGIRRAPDGRILAVFDGDLGRLLEYAADGSFSGRQIGRSGAGPVEFSAIKDDFSFIGDTIVIHDWVQRRRTEVDRKTGLLVRTVSGAPDGYISVITLPNGRTVFGGPVPLRSTAGQPLHVYRFDGERYVWERSFGEKEPAFRAGLSSLLYRRLYPVASNEFWSARYNEYRIERWSSDGRLLQTIVGDRRWFMPWTREVVRSTEEPPNPDVAGVTVDGSGLLWVLLGAPHSDWRKAISDERDIMGSRLLHPGRPYLVSVLEVIDPQRNVLLASYRFEAGYWRFASPGYLWRTWIDPQSAEPRAELVPFRLVGRE